MTNKQIIDGKECKYWFKPNSGDYRKCSLRGENDNCDEIKNCFVKELLGKLALKEQALDEIKYQVTELFLGVENKDRAYREKILDIINKAKE